MHQWKRKQARSFVLPCLPKHFFRIFLICLFFEYLAQHFDTYMDRSAVKPGNDLKCCRLYLLLLGAALTQPANHLDPHKGATGCCFFNVQLCALWTSTSTTLPHKLSASHFTSASLLIHCFTTGRQLTFLNTKPWSSHKCSQLPSQRQLTNMIYPLETFV